MFKTAWEPELDKHLANQMFQQQLRSNKFLEKNFGHQLAENELQQNLSQDQQQLQDSQLAQKIFQQLNLAQHSFSEKILNNELGKSIFQEFDHQNLDKKQLIRAHQTLKQKLFCHL